MHQAPALVKELAKSMVTVMVVLLLLLLMMMMMVVMMMVSNLVSLGMLQLMGGMLLSCGFKDYYNADNDGVHQ